MNQPVPFTNEQKLLYRAKFRQHTVDALRALFRRAHKKNGLTQKQIASILRADEAQISKQLSSEANLTLNSVADLARAMGARPEFNFKSLDEIKPVTTATKSDEGLVFLCHSASSTELIEINDVQVGPISPEKIRGMQRWKLGKGDSTKLDQTPKMLQLL